MQETRGNVRSATLSGLFQKGSQGLGRIIDSRHQGSAENLDLDSLPGQRRHGLETGARGGSVPLQALREKGISGRNQHVDRHGVASVQLREQLEISQDEGRLGSNTDLGPIDVAELLQQGARQAVVGLRRLVGISGSSQDVGLPPKICPFTKVGSSSKTRAPQLASQLVA